MVNTVFNWLEDAFFGVYNYFQYLLNRTGMTFVVLGAIFAMFAIRFIIYPFLKGGVGASDPVKRVRSKQNE